MICRKIHVCFFIYTVLRERHAGPDLLPEPPRHVGVLIVPLHEVGPGVVRGVLAHADPVASGVVFILYVAAFRGGYAECNGISRSSG